MDNRLFFPATERNRESIGEVLSRILLKRGFILEIGSGSGEHGVVFQKQFPESWLLNTITIKITVFSYFKNHSKNILIFN